MLNEQSNADHTTTIPYSYAASADVVTSAQVEYQKNAIGRTHFEPQ